MISAQQGTLRESVFFEGHGIHTGQSCRLAVHPAPVGHGRRFLTPSGTEIPALIDNVISCDRSTILGRDQDRVHTPEHLLSALVACGVDNAILEMSGPEVPILDGSALAFFQAFETVGVSPQGEVAPVLTLDAPLSCSGQGGQLVLALPAEETVYEYALHYPHPMLGYQHCQFSLKAGDYLTEIAPARTFALWEEVQPLIERGMAQGGDISNALVVYQDRYSSDLKVENEPVRHKCLDLIGDFALLGRRLQARVLAVKAGHRWHVECARKIWEEYLHESA